VTFAIGPFERHPQKIKFEKGGEIQLELNSLAGAQVAIKEDFILAELDNSIRYFASLFGDYPYPQFGAVVHPYGFGQGFATMLTIPPTDSASKYVYSFVSHETAHQWWGNIVAWRSYRDQWLSEGFAEYSGLLYTAKRDSSKGMRELMGTMRNQLKDVPVTTVGVGKGRLYDVGPLILGHRLNTSKTFGAYQALIYSKGAFVLRMMHYLFSNPSTGDGQPFFNMMTDFVNRYRNKSASSDDFREVANEHFARTPLAQKYQLKDLNWFFSQWVYGTAYPSYRLEYQLTDQPDGTVIMVGTVFQDNAPDGWFMPLPVVMEFAGNQIATGSVHALGKQTPVSIKLPKRPTK
jgi:aminopeptidase N